jgi:signal transduction histidine kinase/CheY-like chemotaxis protein
MLEPISFFNWSVNKILNTESDTLNRARIKILFAILLFSLAKVLIVAPLIIWQQHDYFQFARVLGFFAVYLLLLKLLLADKRYVPVIANIMAWLGLFLIWTNILVTAQSVNILTVQFIAMLILSSFYLLNRRLGITYSVLGILPVALFLIFGKQIVLTHTLPNELASPGYEILSILNFATIVITHYLFSNAFTATIAEKETLNRQLQLAAQEANEASASKSDFLSTMSHELRTPLISVLGISELMLKDSHLEEQEENLKILKYSAENLHSLINNILDYNKLDSDKLNLENISVNLAEMIKNLSSGLYFQAKQKGIDFILDIDKAITGRYIITDPTRIAQIIYNLAGNAIKFTNKGSVTLSLRLIDRESSALNIRFSVIDTGIGISEEQQKYIFEPFTQATSSTTRKFGGTGLGLGIVKRLLTIFGSNIHIKSIPGSGSTFYFDIAFKTDTEPLTNLTEEPEAEFDLTGIKILVAEDNPMSRLLLTKIFSKRNNQPVFAQDGYAAIDEIRSNEYDVVLMDLNMPLLNGYEATRAIRAMEQPAKSNVFIIAVTAAVDEDLQKKITDAGMDDYIIKPFKINELYSKLNNISLKI